MSPYCDRGGGVEHGVLRRQAEHHRDVAELEVAVDQHDRLGRPLRHRGGDVDRDAGLADATLGREDDDQAPGLAGHGWPAPARGWSGAGEQLTDAVDRLVEARLAADHDRVTGAGAQRLLEHVGRQLVDREDRRRATACALVTPVHVLEADRARRTRVRTPPRPAASGLSCWTRSSIVSNCAAPASSTASRVRRFGSGSTTATSKLAPSRGARRPWRTTPRRYLLLAAALAAPAVGAGWSGGSSTR